MSIITLFGNQVNTNSTNLYLNDNNIIDISPLKETKLPNLLYLSLNYNNITDISPLKETEFSKLKNLYLNNNNIIDISPLKETKLPDLLSLYLNDNNITDISPLKETKLPKLKNLYLNNNNITDISPLKETEFSKLKNLYLNNNNIIDISPLKETKLPNLYNLYLNNNNITDISPLKETEFLNLENLSLNNNNITDISPLKETEFLNLENLSLNNNQIRFLPDELKNTKYSLYLDGNPLIDVKYLLQLMKKIKIKRSEKKYILVSGEFTEWQEICRHLKKDYRLSELQEMVQIAILAMGHKYIVKWLASQLFDYRIMFGIHKKLGNSKSDIKKSINSELSEKYPMQYQIMEKKYNLSKKLEKKIIIDDILMVLNNIKSPQNEIFHYTLGGALSNILDIKITKIKKNIVKNLSDKSPSEIENLVKSNIQDLSKRELCIILGRQFEEISKIHKHDSGCDPDTDLQGNPFDEMNLESYVKEPDSSQCWSINDYQKWFSKEGFKNPYTKKYLSQSVIEFLKQLKQSDKIPTEIKKLHELKVKINPLEELGQRVINKLTHSGTQGYLDIENIREPGQIDKYLDRLKNRNFAYQITGINQSILSFFGVQDKFQNIDPNDLESWLKALDKSMVQMTQAGRFDDYRNALYTVLTYSE
jgi:Leucine-rich repeat (LRR) protein